MWVRIRLQKTGAFKPVISVIAVSHDRWFIQRFGGKLWELVDRKIFIGL